MSREAVKARLGARGQLLSFSGASLVFQAVYLLQNATVARLLGPSLVGLWDALTLLTLYNVTHLGVLNAVHREIPIARGRGDRALVLRLRDQGLIAAVLPSSMLGAAVLVFALVTWQQSTPEVRIGLVGLVVLVVVQQLHGYLQVLLRADNRFHLLAVNQVVLCTAVAVQVGLVFLLGFSGQVFGAIAVQATGCAAILLLAGYRLRFALEPKLYAQLVRMGFPIAIMVFADGLLSGMDRLVILTFLGTTELGYFRLAVLANGLILFLPNIIGQMIYPRLGEAYGASGRLSAMRSVFERPTHLLALVLPLLVGNLFLLLPGVVEFALPDFRPGVGAARAVIEGLYGFAVLGMGSYVLLVANRPLEVVAGQLGAAAVKALLAAVAVAFGFGLDGLAHGVALGYLIYGVWVYSRGLLILGYHRGELPLRVALVLLPIVVGTGLAVALDMLSSPFLTGWPTVARELLLAAAFTGIYAGFVLAVLRRTMPDVWAAAIGWRWTVS